MQLLDDAGPRRWHLHRRLGGLDLDDGLVQGDLVALFDKPTQDVGFGQALTEVGEREAANRHQNARERSTASSTRSRSGR